MIRRFHTSADIQGFAATPLYTGFDTGTLEDHRPDLHLVKIQENVPAARCSLWWRETPAYEDERVGLIGHYAALNDEAAQAVLDEALETLRDQGCTLAVGPVDGNTWRSYRFSIWGDAPGFFLEPLTPEAYPAQWERADFKVLATYYSVLQTKVEASPKLGQRLCKLRTQGIEVRSLVLSKAEEELEHIFDLTLKSFRQNFLYSPITRGEFMGQYRKLLPLLQPELVLLAEKEGELIAYVFALPDLAQSERGEPLDTFIIKTLAVVPRFTGRGLASTLIDALVKRAHDLGFTRAVHALMLDSNHSRKISARYAERDLRRYALYAKPL